MDTLRFKMIREQLVRVHNDMEDCTNRDILKDAINL